jgi:hypothetical protein
MMKFIAIVKKRRFLWLFTALFLAAGFTSFQVQAYQGMTIVDPRPLDTIYPIQDKNAPALVALAAIYTPVDSQESWSRTVCAGMTEGGCDYFRTNQAAAVWNEQSGNAASTTRLMTTAAVIDDTHQLWKAQTTVFTQAPTDKHAKESIFDVYVLVQRAADQKWYLDRVLVGPGIAQ